VTQVPTTSTKPTRPTTSPQPVSAFGEFETGRDPGQRFPAAYCQVAASDTGAALLYCWTPDDGYTLGLGSRGTPRRLKGDESFNRGRTPGGYATLGVGHRRSGSGFSCISQHFGLTCRDSEGHGWTLPRYVGLPSYF
jgi:hypothetical protein